jgi:hypothetical protein
VTVTWNASIDQPDIRVLEYRGLDKTNPLDTATAGSGNSASAAVAPATTQFAPELLVNGGTTNGSFSVAAPAFTVRTITAQSDLAADRIVTSAGTYPASTPLPSADTWVMQLAAFH